MKFKLIAGAILIAILVLVAAYMQRGSNDAPGARHTNPTPTPNSQYNFKINP